MTTILFTLLLANTPSVRFERDANDDLRDKVTGLVIRSGLILSGCADSGGRCTHAEHTATCGALPNGPWRLPTVHEMLSLLDPRRETDYPATFVLPGREGLLDPAYWTQTAGGTNEHHVVVFKLDGVTQIVQRRLDTTTAFVRCVK